MNTNPKRTKLFIGLAIGIIALLLIISIGQIIAISNQTKENRRLEQEITRLDNLVKYHENQQGLDNLEKDDKDIDNEIVLGGEQ